MASRQTLTEDMRSEIKRLHDESGQSYTSLAEQYSVSPKTVARICNPEKYAEEKQRNEEYRKRNIHKILDRRKKAQREFHLRLSYAKDTDMIDHLDSLANVNGYLRTIIRRDMEDNISKISDQEPPEAL